MKQLFLLFSALCCMMAANAHISPDEIAEGAIVKKDSVAIYVKGIFDDEGQKAIDEIRNAMQEYSNVPYFNNLVAREIDDIKNTYDNNVINEKKEAALNRLNTAIPAYRAAITDVVGTLGTQQKGRVIEVTDQKDQVFKFYNPKKVTPIEVK